MRAYIRSPRDKESDMAKGKSESGKNNKAKAANQKGPKGAKSGKSSKKK